MSAAKKFVSRAGAKIEHALETFDVDVTGFVCADLGCNVGGFSDCLLQRGAVRIHAVDTAYGVLDYSLRRRDDVIVHERSNALHLEPAEAVDLVVIDLGWTPQRHALPAAATWLRPGGRIISLVKPHYELDRAERDAWLEDGCLPEDRAETILTRVIHDLPSQGFELLSHTQSPIRGGKSGRKGKGRGNVEYLMLVHPQPAAGTGAQAG